MAEFAFTLTAAPILGGTDQTIGANRIIERDDLALVSIAVPLNDDAAVEAALKKGWGLAMPSSTLSTVKDDTRAVRTAADQLMLIFPHATPDAEPVVRAKLKGAGYTTDQTDVWVALQISGPDTVAALERLCPLDTATMAENASARTVMEHMGALIIRLGPDRFLLLSASSSAKSFLHAVETSYHNVVA